MTLDLNRIYTPKEALDADPDWTIPVKLGRGRMPKGGDEHIKALVAKGYRVKGYEIKNVPTSTAEPAAPVVNKAAPANIKEVKEFTIFWPEDDFKAVNIATGKVLPGKWGGMREVCNFCRVSLVQCQCGHPKVVGDVSVKIVPK